MGWKVLTERFAIDFMKEGLGRAHLMNFGSKALYTNKRGHRRSRPGPPQHQGAGS